MVRIAASNRWLSASASFGIQTLLFESVKGGSVVLSGVPCRLRRRLRSDGPVCGDRRFASGAVDTSIRIAHAPLQASGRNSTTNCTKRIADQWGK